MKLGDVSAAINACVVLNQWSTALTLAETHHFKEIEEFLSKYATHILSQNRKKEAVELFRKANYCQKSAKLLFEMAHDSIKTGQSPLTIKKFFVLGAMEVERHFSIQKSSRNNTTTALDNLILQEKKSDGVSLDRPWRGAEGYHYYMLAQRQFYTGQLEAAVITV